MSNAMARTVQIKWAMTGELMSIQHVQVPPTANRQEQEAVIHQHVDRWCKANDFVVDEEITYTVEY